MQKLGSSGGRKRCHSQVKGVSNFFVFLFFLQGRFAVLTAIKDSDDVYPVSLDIERDDHALSIIGNAQTRPDIVTAEAPTGKSPQAFAVCHDGIRVLGSNVWRCCQNNVPVQFEKTTV